MCSSSDPIHLPASDYYAIPISQPNFWVFQDARDGCDCTKVLSGVSFVTTPDGDAQ